MGLASGAPFGSFVVIRLIGKGGMGEVYHARDTRLKRDVALKVLPDEFAGDPERLARFRREAQILASLNHPNIAAIHGLEEGDAGRALVMELVDGADAGRSRSASGALPVDEALRSPRQIADALEAAHEQGIIHRDLKPAQYQGAPRRHREGAGLRAGEGVDAAPAATSASMRRPLPLPP